MKVRPHVPTTWASSRARTSTDNITGRASHSPARVGRGSLAAPHQGTEPEETGVAERFVRSSRSALAGGAGDTAPDGGAAPDRSGDETPETHSRQTERRQPSAARAAIGKVLSPRSQGGPRSRVSE